MRPTLTCICGHCQCLLLLVVHFEPVTLGDPSSSSSSPSIPPALCNLYTLLTPAGHCLGSERLHCLRHCHKTQQYTPELDRVTTLTQMTAAREEQTDNATSTMTVPSPPRPSSGPCHQHQATATPSPTATSHQTAHLPETSTYTPDSPSHLPPNPGAASYSLPANQPHS